MEGLAPLFRWAIRPTHPIGSDFLEEGLRRGLSERVLRVAAARGFSSVAELTDPPASLLHDPALLPDAGPFSDRIRRAVEDREHVLVFGDFDADGLTGLAIMVSVMRRLGLDVAPYVPDRSEEGHGLSLAAVDLAAREGRTVIITVDTGTSSVAEIATAQARAIDVLVTDHHRITGALPPALAVVNPHRADSRYPDQRLAGAGVAFKVAQLLLGEEAFAYADLAAIGTIADVAPLVGENRAIVTMGLELLRRAQRPGIAALLLTDEDGRAKVDVEGVSFGIAPRLNAVGRVGDAAVAARLLLTKDGAEATALAAELRAANTLRRELTALALGEARALVVASEATGATVAAGPWPIGVIGLVAGRLAEEYGRPAVIFSTLGDPWRGSARSSGGFDLAAAFAALGDLFVRFGGHSAAAGCHLPSAHYDEFRRRLGDLAGRPISPDPTLTLDLVVDAIDTDYRLFRELALLEPSGAGNPPPLVGIRGLVVGRARVVAGGNTQLVLRKGREVLDGIAFGREDIASMVAEGEKVDVVARLASRSFAGFESLQLELRDVGPAGLLDALEAASVLELAVA